MSDKNHHWWLKLLLESKFREAPTLKMTANEFGILFTTDTS